MRARRKRKAKNEVPSPFFFSPSPSLPLSLKHILYLLTDYYTKKKEPSALKKRFVSLFPNLALALTKINLTFLLSSPNQYLLVSGVLYLGSCGVLFLLAT